MRRLARVKPSETPFPDVGNPSHILWGSLVRHGRTARRCLGRTGAILPFTLQCAVSQMSNIFRSEGRLQRGARLRVDVKALTMPPPSIVTIMTAIIGKAIMRACHIGQSHPFHMPMKPTTERNSPPTSRNMKATIMIANAGRKPQPSHTLIPT